MNHTPDFGSSFLSQGQTGPKPTHSRSQQQSPKPSSLSKASIDDTDNISPNTSTRILTSTGSRELSQQPCNKPHSRHPSSESARSTPKQRQIASYRPKVQYTLKDFTKAPFHLTNDIASKHRHWSWINDDCRLSPRPPWILIKPFTTQELNSNFRTQKSPHAPTKTPKLIRLQVTPTAGRKKPALNQGWRHPTPSQAQRRPILTHTKRQPTPQLPPLCLSQQNSSVININEEPDVTPELGTLPSFGDCESFEQF